MSARPQPDRTRLLRSKQEQLQAVVTSRKRKLIELYAVCVSDSPLPTLSPDSIDAQPTTTEEDRFLDVSDILQNRFFDEKNLPTRRQLRSDTAKKRSPIRKVSPDVRSSDSVRAATKLQRDGSKSRKSRAPTPSSRSDAGQGGETSAEGLGGQGLPMQRSTSKGSQTDLPAESSAVLNEIVEETFEHASRQQPTVPDDAVPPGQLESERIGQLGSRPNSPGVDPRKAMPILAEDAARLDEPLVNGLGSHDGPPHKALTVHLPPKEVQERHLEDVRRHRDHLATNLSPHDGERTAELLSSPGSTSAHSATTPALHEVSTDTSPDHEGRYDAERLDKDVESRTPIEDRRAAEECAERKQQERIRQAQIAVTRDEILQSSPITPEEQLLLEGQAAIERPGEPMEGVKMSVPTERANARSLTKEAGEAVQDIVDDDQETARAQKSPRHEAAGATETSSIQHAAGRPSEIPDSEAEDTPPSSFMDVDSTVAPGDVASKASSANVPKLPKSSDAPESSSPDHSQKPIVVIPSNSRREPTPVTPVLERMTTRVSSGAMRHKSVSEILGEIPRPNTNVGSDRIGPKLITDTESAGISNSPRSGTPQSPGTRKSLLEKAKEKERSKLSKVVFAKQPAKQSDSIRMPNGNELSLEAKEDYFNPLFLAAAEGADRSTLECLLSKAHKTISTENAYLPLLENQAVRVLNRIYNLQKADKWALRQPKRSDEPQRPSTHWDVVLQEAKWMRTDFREERKWKMTVARNLALACAEWHEASPEDRKKIQVKATPPPLPKDIEMGELSSPTQDTPDLVSSADIYSSMDEDEEPRLDLPETVAPFAIFGLQDDDVVFGLRNSPTAHQLLDELPMYGTPLCVPSSEPPSKADLNPDRFWKREALPVSKYVDGRMDLLDEGPPRKKSRFDHEEEEDDEEQIIFGDGSHKRPVLPPEQDDVALFNPEHKHIRDRIHAGHQFRPPSEYPMPLQSFFENRQSSQWTLHEDDDLRRYVRDYSYNWSLIANMLQSKSMFSSGAERRTPWECFERWVSLEGLPGDMQKTHYFRAYTSRLDAANRNVTAMASQPQQANANGQIQPPRRRTTSSVRVERRRNQKHLTLVDAMRKLAKKRENAAQKQQQAAGLAASRKAPDAAQQRAPPRTPLEFSKLKHEQMEKMRENMMAMQQRQEAQRRAMMQQRQQQQNGQQLMPPNGQQRPPPHNGVQMPNGVNGMPNPVGQNLQVPGQNRPRPPLPPQMANQGMQNGLRPPQGLMNGIVPQAQMQGMQGQMPLPNPALDVGLINQAQSIQQQQRQAVLRQQGHMPGPVHNSPPRNMNGMSPPAGYNQMQNGNMMSFVANSNTNVSSPGTGPSPQGLAGSPRMGHLPQTNPQQTIPQALERQIRSQFPNATNEHIMIMIKEEINKSYQKRNGLVQSAMNAAAGGNMNMGNNMMVPNGARLPSGVESSPQMYAQMLRQQQESQQKAAQQQAAAAQQANTGPAHQRTPSGNNNMK